MKVVQTSISEVIVIEPKLFGDERGFFLETFSEQRYREEAGLVLPFVQDNYSRSTKGVLRGLHFQKTKPQGKLVRCVLGEVFDVAVDIRKGSPTYGQWESVVLTAENKKQFYVPPGFAHGFQVLTDVADFEYKCTDYYDSSDEGGVIWDDPELAISWPLSHPILSEKDQNHRSLDQLSV